MTENKLKSMAENNKFEELMNNRQELERLSNITDISEVLEVLNRYGYNGTKQDLERDLFEILQGLSEDDLKNISGGKILNKKYLAGLMGGLTMMSSIGLRTSAQVDKQSNVKTKSETSFLNKIDKTVFGVVGGSFAVGGIFVEALNLMFRKNKIEYITEIIEKENIVESIDKDTDFALTEEQQKIYEDTKKLSDMILTYVREYIEERKAMPAADLNENKKEQKDILDLIGAIRTDWINKYESSTNTKMDDGEKENIINNVNVYGNHIVSSVYVNCNALEFVFTGLPVGHGVMGFQYLPERQEDIPASLKILAKLWYLDKEYRIAFAALEKQCQKTSDCDPETGTKTDD